MILSLVEGVLLAALGFSPFELIESIGGWSSGSTIGACAVEQAGRYFLLGDVIVFPVWFVTRRVKTLGRGTSGDLRGFPQSGVAEPGGHESPGPSPAAGRSPPCAAPTIGRSIRTGFATNRAISAASSNRGPSGRVSIAGLALAHEIARLDPSLWRMAISSAAEGGEIR